MEIDQEHGVVFAGAVHLNIDPCNDDNNTMNKCNNVLKHFTMLAYRTPSSSNYI